MASITKTVGSGGDYATWEASFDWLLTQSPLSASDDYTFTAISSFTEPSFGATHAIDWNGATVVFDGAGFTTTVGSGGSNSAIKMSCTVSSGIIEVKNFVVEFVAGASSGISVANLTASGSSIHDCIITGSGTASVGAGITPNTHYLGYMNLYNCRVYNCNIGVGWTGGTSNSSVDSSGRRKWYNCSVYGCGGGYFYLTGNASYINTRDCFAFDCTTGWGGGPLWQTKNDIDYCGESDGTLDIAGAGIGANNLHNLTSTDQVKSIVSGEADFLKPKSDSVISTAGEGSQLSLTDLAGVTWGDSTTIGAYKFIATRAIDFVGTPLTGKAPQTVAFTSTYTD
jgi:hypothetical protein